MNNTKIITTDDELQTLVDNLTKIIKDSKRTTILDTHSLKANHTNEFTLHYFNKNNIYTEISYCISENIEKDILDEFKACTKKLRYRAKHDIKHYGRPDDNNYRMVLRDIVKTGYNLNDFEVYKQKIDHIGTYHVKPSMPGNTEFVDIELTLIYANLTYKELYEWLDENCKFIDYVTKLYLKNTLGYNNVDILSRNITPAATICYTARI